jgi:hypothetical protein
VTDLETKLAEARERCVAEYIAAEYDCCAHADDIASDTSCFKSGFDACAAIAREVVAEKDAEIARLKAEIVELRDGEYHYVRSIGPDGTHFCNCFAKFLEPILVMKAEPED